MAKPLPDYRTDPLVCPLNKGKLGQVVELVVGMRKCAGFEAKLQWRQFFERDWNGFEASARQGWTRPWVKDQTLTVSHGQMVMSQVAGSLQGYLGNVQNTFVDLVAGSTLPPKIRQQLYFINKKHAWFWKCHVSLTQAHWVSSGKTGDLREVSSKVVVSDDVRTLAKDLIRKALSMHRKPNFKRFQPQIDQRSCLIQGAHTAQHGLWLNLALRTPGSRVDLPLLVHPGFVKRQERLKAAQALRGYEPASVAGELSADPDENHSSPETPQAAPLTKKSKERNTHPAPYTLAKTVRLVLAEDHRSLVVCVATDMRQAFEHSRSLYQSKTPVTSLDTGLCALLASDKGDLLGRNWSDHLSRIDRILTGIARHRQAQGLPVRSERYVHHVNRLRGYLKTEVNRIFNRLVQTKAPGHIVMEALDFSNAQMSRRLNRLIRNFGKGLITQKLLELEKQFGITHEFRNPAYTSQQCNGCGYTDPRNRKTQSQFHCKFCNKKIHADVNGARVSLDRRSIEVSRPGNFIRVRSTLIEQVKLFNERFTRPRGGPADPRFSNPYFKAWTDGVRSPEARMLPSSACALV